MAKVVFPSYDVQTINGRAGGVGSFITHFARQLRARGDEVTIIAATGGEKPISVDGEWRRKYRSWGIEIVEVHNKNVLNRWPDVWTVRLSELITPLLKGFDVAYFSDWGNVGFNTVRMKRLGAKALPVCVTVLHGPSNWCRLLDGDYPIVPDHLYLEFLERYTANHSDHVVAPSRYIVKWASEQGWQFQNEPEVLGLPFLPGDTTQLAQSGIELNRLLFFGRLERRKGYDIFVDAVARLSREAPEILAQLSEIVLLGHEDVSGAVSSIPEKLQALQVPVRHIGDLDSAAAQAFLSANAAGTLVVVPSRFENFPYAVIESSLIPGLNLICTRGGGTPEIFSGKGDAQLFEPTASALAAKIREMLQRPLLSAELARYDFAHHNDQWLKFHERVSSKRSKRSAVAAIKSAPTVDVCTTYFNKARHFPQLLESLSMQTYRNFRVIAVDDGSTDPDAAEAFATQAEKYRDRGWIFFRQSNQFVDAARNNAAKCASADYLLFVDGDDVLALNAIERLVEAASESGDDCLTPGVLRFSGDAFPYDKISGKPSVPFVGCDMPLGPVPALTLFDPAALGGHVILIRRSVFEAIGGYRELHGAAHEDWELHSRLAFAGYRTDVVPEYLHFYRQAANSLSRTVDPSLAKQRLIGTCDRSLGTIGLHGAAAALNIKQQKLQKLHWAYWRLERQLQHSCERFNVFGFDPPHDDQVPVSVPAPQLAPSHRSMRARRINVMVLVPTLNVGGAEIDLLRNLPSLNRNYYKISVFTFLARGSLAPKLAAEGIEILGPFVALEFRWLRNLNSALSLLSRHLRRAIVGLRELAVAIAPGPMRRLWRWGKDQMWFQNVLHRGKEIVRALREMWRTRRRRTGLRALLSAAVARYLHRLLDQIPMPVRNVLRDCHVLSVYLAIGAALGLVVRARGFDIIHTILPNSYIVGSVANVWPRRRPLIMGRVSLNWYQRNHVISATAEKRLFHKRVAAAVGNCRMILDELRQEGVPFEKLRLIYNGLDAADFTWRMIDRNGARERLKVPARAVVLCVVANLHPYKGHADLLQALRGIANEMPDWVLLVVGDDINGNRAELEQMSDAFGLSKYVRFLGHRSDTPIILSAADIHVSASHTEGLPNNIIEAMCARLPVVATAVGGVDELVTECCGILVPRCQPAAMGEAILRLVCDVDERQRMGDAGYDRVVSYFSIERSVMALERLYSETVRNEAERQHAQPADILAPSVLRERSP